LRRGHSFVESQSIAEHALEAEGCLVAPAAGSAEPEAEFRMADELGERGLKPRDIAARHKPAALAVDHGLADPADV
jgi:hypothetical protein